MSILYILPFNPINDKIYFVVLQVKNCAKKKAYEILQKYSIILINRKDLIRKRCIDIMHNENTGSAIQL